MWMPILGSFMVGIALVAAWGLLASLRRTHELMERTHCGCPACRAEVDPLTLPPPEPRLSQRDIAIALEETGFEPRVWTHRYVAASHPAGVELQVETGLCGTPRVTVQMGPTQVVGRPRSLQALVWLLHTTVDATARTGSPPPGAAL